MCLLEFKHRLIEVACRIACRRPSFPLLERSKDLGLTWFLTAFGTIFTKTTKLATLKQLWLLHVNIAPNAYTS